MNKWTSILLGLLLIIIPLILATLVWQSWWVAALVALKGALFWVLVGLGVLFILLGISDLKNDYDPQEQEKLKQSTPEKKV